MFVSICGRIVVIGFGVGFVVFFIGVWWEFGCWIVVGVICWLVFGIFMLINGFWFMGYLMYGFYIIGIVNIIVLVMLYIELSVWFVN